MLLIHLAIKRGIFFFFLIFNSYCSVAILNSGPIIYIFMQSVFWTDNTNPACGPSHDHEPIVNLDFKFLHAMAKATAPLHRFRAKKRGGS